MTLLNQAVALAVNGNIAPAAIEIDSPSANLHPGGDAIKCSSLGDILPAGTDWVADCLTNSDTPSLVDSIATGLITGVTAAAGGFGHWNGVRIVDGVNGGDQDIFLTGGKENDTSTWNVGPGTVGSSKYDATQAYLANNQTDLFFGMERRGNNGTTAVDFEFNQSGAAGGYIPTRTVGDVLITFLMQGSGGSGSAEPFLFTWDGSHYDGPSALPPGTLATINDSTSTPGAPWGHVDSKGNWVTGALDRFQFAEAKVPLTVLPGVNGCGGTAFVQIRTRSSTTDNSDLKDTTKIFEFVFNAPSITIEKSAANGLTSTVTVQKKTLAGVTTPQYQWQKKVGVSWVNIAGATSSSLVYSNFEADDTSPQATGAFTIASGAGSGNYVGKVFTVTLRLHVTDAAGAGCQADSAGVTVKKVIAVDP